MYITVSANVSDESGANVYVAAFESIIDKDVWKANIENGIWDLESLSVRLGGVPTGEVLTGLSGNIYVGYANLEDQTPNPVDVTKVYYVYLYAVDSLNNSVSVAYENAVSINVDTTTLVEFDLFMQYVSSNPPLPGNIAQLRNSPPIPNVTYSNDLFRFYEQDTFPEWNQKLYANIHVNPEESILMGNVYTIAVETQAVSLNDVANCINNNLDATRVYDGTPFYNANIDHPNEEIHMFYPNVDAGVSNVSMAFGKSYYVYSMVKDIGFNTDVVMQNNVVTTGTNPIVNAVNITVIGYITPFTFTIGGNEYSETASNSLYRITLDRTTDEDPTKTPWVLVLNYMHKGGTNPALSIRTTTNGFPILPSDGSLDFDSPSANVSLPTSSYPDGSSYTESWGHTGLVLFDKVCIALGSLKDADNGCEIRFVGKTQAHTRIMHFKTTNVGMFKEFRYGNVELTTGTFTDTVLYDISYNSGGVTPLHTALLPISANRLYNFFGDATMTNEPFFSQGISHWNINKNGRWEMDDYPRGGLNNTYHQIWVRVNK